MAGIAVVNVYLERRLLILLPTPTLPDYLNQTVIYTSSWVFRQEKYPSLQCKLVEGCKMTNQPKQKRYSVLKRYFSEDAINVT